MAERAGIPGRAIGKIEIFDDKSIVGVPADRAEQILHSLKGLKINGCPAPSRLSSEKPSASPRPGARKGGKPVPARAERAAKAESAAMDEPVRRGKVRLSENARAKLLDASDLSRFEIRKPRESGLKSARDIRNGKHPSDRRKFDREPRGNRKNNDRGSTHRSKKRQG